MREYTHVIKDAHGVHARNAMEFSAAARKYMCDIYIEGKGRRADGKEVFALMNLTLCNGDEIRLRAEGEDETEALETLQDLMVKIF